MGGLVYRLLRVTLVALSLVFLVSEVDRDRGSALAASSCYCAGTAFGHELTLALIVASPALTGQGGVLLAGSGGCVCSGSAFGHQYGGGFVGSQNGAQNMGSTANNVQCASGKCQPWIWAMGKAVCDAYGLNGGVGYVVLSWSWYFMGTPQDSGYLVQQYDCDDL
jgi:hypothetical protein